MGFSMVVFERCMGNLIYASSLQICFLSAAAGFSRDMVRLVQIDAQKKTGNKTQFFFSVNVPISRILKTLNYLYFIVQIEVSLASIPR